MATPAVVLANIDFILCFFADAGERFVVRRRNNLRDVENKKARAKRGAGLYK
ncbi:MAG: hypothetical protein IE937_05635 [Gammaproteobacteria bacterium]|jgi:hypothetical protein|nr:hypothetical protein [Gammaproteobacteria bacterium]MBD3775946.1 hypothetical protein [Thiotrichales bacterium]